MRAEKLKVKQASAADRTAQIIASAEKLRAEVEEAKRDIEERKRNFAKRKEDLKEASQGLDVRRSRQLADTEKTTQRTKYKWNRNFEHVAGTRAFLCRESAKLYGLRRNKKGGSWKYELGGLEIPELRGMISKPWVNHIVSVMLANDRPAASPEVISTSLAHITHVLMLAAHYLSLRLPAEITQPHHDYPRPTIFSLQSSYRHDDIAYPGSVAIPSTAAPGDKTKTTPRPRPLFVDKPLLVLAKEEPTTYSLFIEGVVLLAYNIAWACHSQGVPVGEKASYEDICNMGRNLYNLLIGSQLSSNINARPVQDIEDTDDMPETSSAVDQLGGNSKAMLGRYSHGATNTNLNSAAGSELMRSFRLPNPVKLADRLKKRMLSDADNLDWEMLNDEAWAPDDEPTEEGVQKRHQVKGKSRATPAGFEEDTTDDNNDRRLFGVESVMSTMTTKTAALESTIGDFDRVSLDDALASPERTTTTTPKPPGTSGWTRIKSRQPDS